MDASLTSRSDFMKRGYIVSRKASSQLRQVTTGFLAIVTALLLGACQSSNQIHVPPQIAAHATPPASRALGAGDVIKLTFAGTPELNQIQKIQADGNVSLPLIGQVAASGKVLSAFQAELAALYKSQLQQNEVVVTLEYSATSVYVSGAVNKPSKIMLDRPMTALEAIMESGGFAPASADPSKVVIIRQENGQQHTHSINLKPALKGKTTDSFYLKPYDVIYVSDQDAMF